MKPLPISTPLQTIRNLYDFMLAATVGHATRTIVVYHADADGKLAAVLYALGTASLDAFPWVTPIEAKYPAPMKQIKDAITETPSCNVLFVDFCPSEQEYFELLGLVGVDQIMVVDHHLSRKEFTLKLQKQGLGYYADEVGVSGAVQVAQLIQAVAFHHLDPRQAQRLRRNTPGHILSTVESVGRGDTWFKSQVSPDQWVVDRAICSVLGDTPMTALIPEEATDLALFKAKQHYADFIEVVSRRLRYAVDYATAAGPAIAAKALEDAMAKVQVFTVENATGAIRVAFVPILRVSDLADNVNDVDLLMGYMFVTNDKLVVSIRSRNTGHGQISCAELAKRLAPEGGGHLGAGGFSIPASAIASAPVEHLRKLLAAQDLSEVFVTR